MALLNKTDSDRLIILVSIIQARWTTSPSPTRSSIVLDQEKDSLKSHVDCADDGGTSSSSEDAVVLKRRGKKRKGKKSGKNGLREGDKEFKGIPDPGETQVSALGSDSQTGSSRPSVSGEEAASVTQEEILPSATAASEQMLEKEKKSFLTSDLLKQLQRQLDQEVVESEMNIKVSCTRGLLFRSHSPESYNLLLISEEKSSRGSSQAQTSWKKLSTRRRNETS